MTTNTIDYISSTTLQNLLEDTLDDNAGKAEFIQVYQEPRVGSIFQALQIIKGGAEKL